MALGIEFEDRLAILGTLLGAFLIVAALGTLAGMPWTTNESTVAVAVQLVGIVATLGVGALLVVITYGTEPGELLP